MCKTTMYRNTGYALVNCGSFIVMQSSLMLNSNILDSDTTNHKSGQPNTVSSSQGQNKQVLTLCGHPHNYMHKLCYEHNAFAYIQVEALSDSTCVFATTMKTVPSSPSITESTFIAGS